MKSTATPKRSRGVSPASSAQREKVREEWCVACGRFLGECDPAHLIDRSLLTEGQDDPRAVVALCRTDHRDYDEGRLDLLPFWQRFAVELGFAVERFGPRALRRISNTRDAVVSGHTENPQ